MHPHPGAGTPVRNQTVSIQNFMLESYLRSYVNTFKWMGMLCLYTIYILTPYSTAKEAKNKLAL